MNENLVSEWSQELRFILEVLIGFGQFLREVSVRSLLLDAVFPPDLGYLLPLRASPLLVLDLSEINHFLVHRLYSLPGKRDDCRAKGSLLLKSSLKFKFFQLVSQLVPQELLAD